ncbi:MAG: tRNA pseudouridine(55) synthase TruB [Melioribacteraceae bacterium]|nr:tRNA pseudouridine(55) synthase TruB [Melioribacteraceae bacterium]
MITKKQTDLENVDFASGQVIIFDKDLKASSFSVVYKVRKTVKVKKVGHAGTLDPYATGLLILCTGKKTKEIYKYQDLPKTYIGRITLGKKTPSMDVETDVSEEKSIDGISEDKICKVRDSFLGTIEQTPPMYSAIKHKGKSLYKYARKGEEIKREPREVSIYDFELTKIELPDVYFKIKCSKGTYIRVIANDFGDKLGCGGYLTELRRTEIGDIKVEDAWKIEDFKNLFEPEPVEE